MMYEAWEIRELITNFAYEGNEKRKRDGESEEKLSEKEMIVWNPRVQYAYVYVRQVRTCD